MDTVKKHLADVRLAAPSNQDEENITSENLEIQAPKEYHSGIRALLGKHGHLWSGKLEHIHATTHRIDLIIGAKCGANAREKTQRRRH